MKLHIILLIFFLSLTLGLCFYDINNINTCLQTAQNQVWICKYPHYLLTELSLLITMILSVIYIHKKIE